MFILPKVLRDSADMVDEVVYSLLPNQKILPQFSTFHRVA